MSEFDARKIGLNSIFRASNSLMVFFYSVSEGWQTSRPRFFYCASMSTAARRSFIRVCQVEQRQVQGGRREGQRLDLGMTDGAGKVRRRGAGRERDGITRLDHTQSHAGNLRLLLALLAHVLLKRQVVGIRAICQHVDRQSTAMYTP